MGRNKKTTTEAAAEPNGNLIDNGTTAATAEPSTTRKPRKPSEPKQYRLEKLVEIAVEGVETPVEHWTDQTPGTTYPDPEAARQFVVDNELLGRFRVTRITPRDTFESKLKASLA